MDKARPAVRRTGFAPVNRSVARRPGKADSRLGPGRVVFVMGAGTRLECAQEHKADLVAMNYN
jgi:hypothetical protein